MLAQWDDMLLVDRRCWGSEKRWSFPLPCFEYAVVHDAEDRKEAIA